ncbi:MAG: phage terminase large subunit [Candidatus Tectomicrobia bacterium]|uniref:Phage terminase large subunit n=1 Tax=Tectimicrobiota bacterium TaxID=2528274 RepID=A0A932HYA0_UNCTE|nr:phage terminase large subunit [Candidatus Tectomicrobia bacterium]
MRTSDSIILNGLLRSSLKYFTQRCFYTVSPGDVFLPNWHHDAIAWRLEQILKGNIRRDVINVPPRNLKSLYGSVALPAWALGHDPTLGIICVSYGESLAAKFSRDCRAVMQSPWYRQAFPCTRISQQKNTESEFFTTAGGFRLATSVGGAVTGLGADLIILDDLMKPMDALSESARESVKEWLLNTLFSRLNNKAEGVIILLMQRLHVEDIAGYLLRTGGWTHLNLPAIAEEAERIQIGDKEFHERLPGEVLHPEREPRHILDEIKANMGTYRFSAQYLQNPMPSDGDMLSWSWFRSYPLLPPKGPDDLVVQSWDVASKVGENNDFSACTTWLRRGKEHYLINVRRVRYHFPTLKKLVISHAREYQADVVLIEDAGSGTPLIEELREEGIVKPIAITPQGSKATRVEAQSAKIEQGRVFLPEDASWLEEFKAEVLQFPHGKHDDQVDSMAQYLAWAGKRNEGIGDLAPEVIQAFREANGADRFEYWYDGQFISLPNRFRFF